MNLTIDNFDGRGALDFTAFVDTDHLPRIVRKLNQPAEMQAWLILSFTDPVSSRGSAPARLGARIELRKSDGSALFTGYLSQAPQQQSLGQAETGLLSRWLLRATGDEFVLDRQTLAARAPVVGRPAGDILKDLASELDSGLEAGGVQPVEAPAIFQVDPKLSWSQHAARLALLCRAAYRLHDRQLVFAPIGTRSLTVDERTPGFDEAALQLKQPCEVINDITMLGETEPQAYVRDYFRASGNANWFTLSHSPFNNSRTALLTEDFSGSLERQRWSVSDPALAITWGGGALSVNVGTGEDGQTVLAMAQTLELGGAALLQHGEVSFSAPGEGILGGLYAGSVTRANCLAGFSVAASGDQCTLQAIINGTAQGAALATVAGRRYVLVTQFYCVEPWRTRQRFHSAQHAAGNGLGGDSVAADLLVVMAVRDISPDVSGLLSAPVVMFSGTLANAPAFATYALVNSASLHCRVAGTAVSKTVPAEVLLTPAGSSAGISQLLGSSIDGANCEIDTTGIPSAVFYSYATPADGDLICVSYRGSGPACERVQDPVSISATAHAGDDGVRRLVVQTSAPPARSSSECGAAATALLEDTTAPAWLGTYLAWSDTLPQEVWPGDGVEITLASRSLQVAATVREVRIDLFSLAEECSRYTIHFANDAAASMSFSLNAPERPAPDPAALHLSTAVASLSAAAIISSAPDSVTIDAGTTPIDGGGIEIRLTDFGWGSDIGRNLLGRFTTRTFDVPRLAESQSYYLRMFDGSTPARYSRYPTLLHLDY